MVPRVFGNIGQIFCKYYYPCYIAWDIPFSLNHFSRHGCISEHAPYCRLLARLFLNLLHIACRGTVLALLAAYLHYLSLAFIGLMVVTNLGLASCLLKTDGSKHLWTACAGILLPNAFISRDTVEVLLGGTHHT